MIMERKRHRVYMLMSVIFQIADISMRVAFTTKTNPETYSLIIYLSKCGRFVNITATVNLAYKG